MATLYKKEMQCLRKLWEEEENDEGNVCEGENFSDRESFSEHESNSEIENCGNSEDSNEEQENVHISRDKLLSGKNWNFV